MKKIIFLLLILLPILSRAQVNGIKQVIVIGVDGLGAAYLEKAENIPNIKRMMGEGSYTLEARNVMPTSSAINWAAMTMGASPTLTGYTEWNSKTPEIPSRTVGEYGIFPTIYEVLKEQKPKSKIGIIYSWDGIGYLFPHEVADLNLHTDKDSLTLSAAIEAIKKGQYNLLFLHFDEVDAAGHGIGWGTPEYFAAIQKMDEQVGKILQAIEESGKQKETIVLLTSDHGGIDKGHGGKDIKEIKIPWIIYGQGIRKNHQLTSSIMTFDTASTLAYIFGLTQPQVWIGRPVKEAFE